jgi:membrane protease YdiL (CAAX protease family)
VVSQAESDGINGTTLSQPWIAVAFALEFTFVNSGLEELFWRVYLYRELGGSKSLNGTISNGDLSTLLHNAPSNNTYGGDSIKTASGDRSDLGSNNSDLESGLLSSGKSSSTRTCEWPPIPAAELPKVLNSCYYASYHVVVMLCFVPWYLAMAGFCGLVVLGRILVHCRDSAEFGLIAGWGIHAGLDGAFCLIMAQLYLKFMR